MALRNSPAEAALRAAVLASPDDLAPRLAYADWLLQQGDPLGEAIRLEFERETGRADEAALARLEALNSAHRSAWEATDQQRFNDWGVSFLRRCGFAEILYAHDWRFLDHLPELFAEEPIRTLYFSFEDRDPARGLARLVALPEFARVRRLELQALGTGLAVDGPKLALVLQSPRFALDRLALGYTAGAVQVLAESPAASRLRTLRIEPRGTAASGRMPPADAERIGGSPHLRSLIELDVFGNRIGDDGVAAISSALHGLESLDVGDNVVRDKGVKTLAAAPLGALTSLGLRGNQRVGDAGAKALAASTTLVKLKRVNCTLTGIGERGRAALAARFGDGLEI